MVKVTFPLNTSPPVVPRLKLADPLLVIEVVELKVFPPWLLEAVEPVMLKLAVPLKVEPLRAMTPLVALTFAPKLVPANVAALPVPAEMVNCPLLMAPPFKVALPVTVRVEALRLSVPEVMVRVVIDVIPSSKG